MSSRSEELISQRLSEIFDKFETNQETQDFYDEVLADLKEATLDYLVQGKTPEEAVAKVFADMGDLSEPLSQMSVVKETAAADIPYQELNEGWSWDSQQDFASNAQSFAKGLKNVAKDIQKNVQPLMDDTLGMVDELMAEPIFAKGRIENAEMLAASWWRLQEDQQFYQVRYDFPQNFIDTVNITKNFGNVALFASEDNEFHMIESNNREDASFGTFEEDGSELIYHEGERPRFQWQFKSFLTIMVPQNFRGDLKMIIPSGRTWLGGLNQLGKIDLRANSGSVMMRELYCKDLQVITTSGSIDLSDMSGHNLSLKAASGSVRITASQFEEMVCQANSGSLKMSEVEFAHANFVTTSGSLRLKNCQGRSLLAHAKNGGIRVIKGTFDKYLLESKNGTVGFDSLKGSGEINSKNGSIKGQSLMMDADVKMESNNGTVRLSIANKDFGFDIRSKNGQIKIDRDVRMKISSKKQALGEVGNSEQPKLSVSSKNGSIYVD